MATRYTANDVRNLSMNITIEARALGLIKDTETVEFQGGSTVNGVSPYMYVQDNMEPGRRVTSTDFLPSFTYKDTMNTVYRMLHSTFSALSVVRRSFD